MSGDQGGRAGWSKSLAMCVLDPSKVEGPFVDGCSFGGGRGIWSRCDSRRSYCDSKMGVAPVPAVA